MVIIKLIVLSFHYVTELWCGDLNISLCYGVSIDVYMVVLLTTFNIYNFYTHNGDDIP